MGFRNILDYSLHVVGKLRRSVPKIAAAPEPSEPDDPVGKVGQESTADETGALYNPKELSVPERVKWEKAAGHSKPEDTVVLQEQLNESEPEGTHTDKLIVEGEEPTAEEAHSTDGRVFEQTSRMGWDNTTQKAEAEPGTLVGGGGPVNPEGPSGQPYVFTDDITKEGQQDLATEGVEPEPDQAQGASLPGASDYQPITMERGVSSDDEVPDYRDPDSDDDSPASGEPIEGDVMINAERTTVTEGDPETMTAAGEEAETGFEGEYIITSATHTYGGEQGGAVSGAEEGPQLQPEPDDEVLVAFEHGDPEAAEDDGPSTLMEFEVFGVDTWTGDEPAEQQYAEGDQDEDSIEDEGAEEIDP